MLGPRLFWFIPPWHPAPAPHFNPLYAQITIILVHLSKEFKVLHFNSWLSLRNLRNVMFWIPSKNRKAEEEMLFSLPFIYDWEFLCSRKPLPNSQAAQVALQPSSFCSVINRREKSREEGKMPPKGRARSPCAASAAHHTCGTLNRPLKYYDMEKITLCFNLSTKEQSNYTAKHSRGRPNKEKSKKIWWKFLRGLTMFNHASGLN